MSSAGPSQSSGKTVFLIIALVGTVLLSCIAIPLCLGVGSFLYLRKSVQGQVNQVFTEMEARAGAIEFVLHLDAGEVQEAYDKTSAGFQSRRTFTAFKNFLDQHPYLREHSNYQIEPSGQPQRFRVGFRKPDGSTVEGTIIMIQENSEWKVEELLLP